ncbi:fimbria/pilus outer membrane usher protein [Providencia sneebia]|uniref:Outer membrane usher protein lpfC n=1 Tax=Providencia sneebia DSM 19967 TaxID=1141660 RepID=K8W5Y1_9GAMM|nr:fimbria/pilus outer membrane usher protein [Providencia sneebia]EKT56008.1 outer membrane usher protein lpfC [Providencia sneebia DSM 19967]
MLASAKRTHLSILILSALLLPYNIVYADDYFEPDLVTDPFGKRLSVDLSPFQKSAYLPGSYRVDVFVNDNYVDTSDIDFINSDKVSEELMPCLSEVQLIQYGIKVDNYRKDSVNDGTKGQCYDLTNIPDAGFRFIPSENKLILGIPQIALDTHILDEHLEQRWDDGIPAIFADYNFSGRNQENTKYHENDNTFYLNLRSGVNVGAWRYRNYGTWNRDSDGSKHWETQLNYIERPIRSMKSRFLAGDNYSDSQIFETIPFRGVKLWSDNQMYPDYASIYAPAISGVASSESTIEVSQNGRVIYRTNVPAGPYEITDVVPLNNGDNLEVAQIGIDGSVQRFIVPFSTVDFLQRKGHLKYSLTSGQYRPSESNNKDKNKDKFFQADAFYGLTDNTTLFGGVQASARYQAYDMGVGFNLPEIGAITADITAMHASPKYTDSLNGQAFRLRYSKGLNSYGTNITFLGYRYMRGDYITMQDLFDFYQGVPDDNAYSRRKNQFDITLTQQLPESLGQITATSSYQTYQNFNNNEQKVESYNVGYTNTFRYFSLNVNYAYYKNALDDHSDYNHREKNNDHVLSMNISIPLTGKFKENWINYGASSNKDGDIDNYVGIGGLAFEDRSLSWNVQQGYGNRGRGNYGSVYGTYKHSYGDLNASYAYQKDNRQYGYGASGSLIASQYGIAATRPLGETNGLVYTPQASGISIENESGAKTNYFGLAVVPNLIPYRSNTIRLNQYSLPENAEVDTPLKEIFPTRGAIVLADYSTQIGNKMLVTLHDTTGKILPFGAYATLNETDERYYVSNFGRIYFSGAPGSDEIQVVWGDKNQHQCKFTYNIKDKQRVNSLYIFDEICR